MNKSVYTKRMFSFLLVALFIFQSVPIEAAAKSPIPIYTQKDLENIVYNLDGNYILMNDITISGVWEAIGADGRYVGKPKNFTGVLDGNGHVIRNLKFNLTPELKAGMAGIFSTNEGTIKNLGVEDSNISQNIETSSFGFYFGFIAAINNGKIENCYNKSSIDIVSKDTRHGFAFIGGISGMQGSGSITKCYNTGNINVNLQGERTSASIGGIVGELFEYKDNKITHSYNTGRIYGYGEDIVIAGIAGGGSIVEYCYNTGAITADTDSYYNGDRAYASGIAISSSVNQCYNIGPIKATTHAGGILAAGGNANNCFNAGSVLSSMHAGGIAVFANFLEEYSGSIQNCYNAGAVYGNNYSFSSGIAYNSPGSTFKNDYSIKALTGNCPDDEFTLTDVQMKQKESYKGFDFENVWTMSQDANYPLPVLKGLSSPAVDTSSDFAGGNGTIYNPYKVSTKKHLDNVRNYPNANFVMINDISFDAADFAPGGEYYYESRGWRPICDGKSIDNDRIFIGIFDGNGHTISNLYVNNDSSGKGGLFGSNFGIIKNLGVVNGDIRGEEAGGIAARNEVGAQILNCYFTGKVTASSEEGLSGMAGGICGGSGAFIRNCYSTAAVTSGGYAGGIVGMAYTGSIPKEISNCYFSGSASGDTVGGIAGDMSYMFEIVNSINVGTLKGNTFVGGIAGDIFGSRVTNCYYSNKGLKAVSRCGTGQEPVSAKYLTPEQLKQKSSYPGFDFNTIWKLDEGMAYPVLR